MKYPDLNFIRISRLLIIPLLIVGTLPVFASGVGQVQQFQKLQQQRAADTRFADYFKKIQEAPRNPQSHLALARVYLERDLLELAIESFHRSLILDSQLAEANFGLSKVYRKKKLKSLEVQELEFAVAKAPQNDSFIYELGVVYMEPESFDFKKAKKQYKSLKKRQSPLATKLGRLMELE